MYFTPFRNLEKLRMRVRIRMYMTCTLVGKYLADMQHKIIVIKLVISTVPTRYSILVLVALENSLPR